jgi:Fic family protein
MAIYIHQLKNWPTFTWNEQEFISLLSEVRILQGKLMGKVELLGFELKGEANLETLIQDVIQTSEIEGEMLNPELVRSSIATRLASKAELLSAEMKQFLDWFNNEQELESLLKAAVAHLWFITIHPFDDGNGRIARAITDMQLSKSDGVNQRFYSMSTEINTQKKGYYTILERTQKDDLDITEWIIWFLDCLKNSIVHSSVIVDKVVRKHHFWVKFAGKISNERQQTMLNKLMDNFEGNLNTSKWAKMTKTSPDTALRDITDLVNKGILVKANAGGRSTNYILKEIF